MVLRLKAWKSRSPPDPPNRPKPLTSTTPADRTIFNAGWSSPVARQAHNLKVIGSNPIPATKIVRYNKHLYDTPEAPPASGVFVSDWCPKNARPRASRFDGITTIPKGDATGISSRKAVDPPGSRWDDVGASRDDDLAQARGPQRNV
jgi:hypothetical protein